MATVSPTPCHMTWQAATDISEIAATFFLNVFPNNAVRVHWLTKSYFTYYLHLNVQITTTNLACNNCLINFVWWPIMFTDFIYSIWLVIRVLFACWRIVFKLCRCQGWNLEYLRKFWIRNEVMDSILNVCCWMESR